MKEKYKVDLTVEKLDVIANIPKDIMTYIFCRNICKTLKRKQDICFKKYWQSYQFY